MHFSAAGRNWVLNTQDDWLRFWSWAQDHMDDPDVAWFMQNKPGWTNVIMNWYDDWSKQLEMLYQAESSGDWSSYYRDAAHSGMDISPEIEKYVDNMIAQQNTQQAQEFEEHMRDTNITSSAQQYSSVGLSPSVISGGISTGNGVAAANNVMGSRSMDRQQLAMQKYQTRIGMAKGLLGMVSQMASSGIYGAAIGSARNAAARLATATAHSGLQVLENMRPELRNQLMKDQAARSQHYDPYQVY